MTEIQKKHAAEVGLRPGTATPFGGRNLGIYMDSEGKVSSVRAELTHDGKMFVFPSDGSRPFEAEMVLKWD